MPLPLIPLAIGAAGLGLGFSVGKASNSFLQTAILFAVAYLVAKKMKVI